VRSQVTHALIFSVYQPEIGQVNEFHHSQTEQVLNQMGIPYKVVEGRYKNALELSFIVSAKYRDLVTKLVHTYNQESYLEQVSDGQCFLVYKDGTSEHIGELRSISEEQAMRSEFWTFDPESAIYYKAGL
jgi:hypothetical protein